MTDKEFILSTNYARIKASLELMRDTIGNADNVLTDNNRNIIMKKLRRLYDKYHKQFKKDLK